MKEEFELKLQNEFPFMKREMDIKDKSIIHNIYQAWGCECSSGWYQLIRDLCKDISDLYAQYEVPVDIVIEQIKEKYASLRFYYSFEDTPLALQAIDCLGGGSLRFEPHNENDNDIKKKMRHEIAQIVRSYEDKSKTVCEQCGKEGIIRMDMSWKRTLCDDCYNNHLKSIEERKKTREISIEEIVDKE